MRRRSVIHLAVACLFATVYSNALDAQRPVAVRDGDEATRRAVATSLNRHVTVDLRGVSRKVAIDALSREAKVAIQYRVPLLQAYPDPVTLHLNDVALGVALDRVLEGTPLRVIFDADYLTIVDSMVMTQADSTVTGVVTGTVRDSAAGRAVRGVTVRIAGTKIAATTNDSGHFTLRGVPVGERMVTVRGFGYRPAEREVRVSADEPAIVRFTVVPVANVLTGVVTTATGVQNRREVGSDIAVLNVDSIRQVAPITSVTDLLEARVPGLFVQHTSGQPGAPSRIRMRGTGSVTRNNDMIVFVDGVRMYAEQSTDRNLNTSARGTSYSVQSPLDQIDPNTIETLEVLKGPSASAVYGSDAANGVIVITTKRGRAGPTRWSLTANRDLSFFPGEYPEGRYRFGHYFNGSPQLCYLGEVNCIVDSVRMFQALNDPRFAVTDGHGPTTNVSVTASGGVNALLYSLTGTVRREDGVFKLPDVEADRFTTYHGGATPPNWMRHPDHYATQSGNSRLDLPLGVGARQVRVGLTNSIFTSDKQTSSLQSAIAQLATTYVDTSTLGREPLISNFAERVTSSDLHSTNALNADWSSLGGAGRSLHADLGLDLLNTNNQILTPRGYTDGIDSVGSFATGRQTTLERTFNVRAGQQLRWMDVNAGFNFDSRSEDDIAGRIIGIPEGITVPNALGENTIQNSVTTSTYGWFVEPHFRFSSRFFVTPSLRLDGGSASGKRVGWGGLSGVTGFPRTGASWLVVDRSDDQGRGFFSQLSSFRLRGSFGMAGVQPSPGANLRLFALGLARADSQTLSVLDITGLGNTKLRPERKRELEGGFDASFWQSRLQISITSHRDMQYDAILPVPVAPSIMDISIDKNIGKILNTGTDGAVDAILFDRSAFGWDAHVAITTLSNKVISLVRGQQPIDETLGSDNYGSGLVSRIIPGYPLYSRWARPVLGYTDRDGNGIISADEVLVGDSLAYIGQENPNYQAVFSTGISLFGRRVTVNTELQYQNGLTQVNGVNSQSILYRKPDGTTQLLSAAGIFFGNDPSAPLSQQAAIAAYLATCTVPGGTCSRGTPYGLAQVVNTLRWRSLSVNILAPTSLTHRLGLSTLNFAVQASNLGLHTNYRGKDPDVSAFSTQETVMDSGQLAEPRTVSFRITLGN